MAVTAQGQTKSQLLLTSLRSVAQCGQPVFNALFLVVYENIAKSLTLV